MKSLPFTLLMIFYSSANFIFAQAGTLDSSFGKNGIVVTKIEGASEFVEATAIQKDGKILIAGRISQNDTSKMFIARYNLIGSVDSRFAKNGIATLDLNSKSAYGEALTIQPDGKIILTGSSYQQHTYYSSYDFTTTRFNVDGSIDSSFGTNGVALTDFYDGSEDEDVSDIILQSDGKIIVIGTHYDGGTEYGVYRSSFACVRYNNDGKPDNNFGIYGKVVVDFQADEFDEEASAHGVAIDNAGRIIIAGENSSYRGGTQPALARLNANNGSLDNTFGVGGKILTTIKDYSRNYIESLVINSNQKIIIGGTAISDTYPEKLCLIEYNDNGLLDSNFGIDGISLNSFNSSLIECSALALQPDGKIISAARWESSSLVTRFLSDGSIDSSFNKIGYTVTAIGFANRLTDISIQSDNKIIAAGDYYNSNVYNISLARYNNDIVLPLTLLNFTAVKNNNCVRLTWQTTQQNIQYFSIQRSTDGNNFNEIGIVKNNIKTFTDLNPRPGINYYRLKEIDVDDHSIYSSIIKIDFTNSSNIVIAPNPVQNILTIKNLGAAKILSITNTQGKTLIKTRSESNTYNWNIQQLPAGIYYLLVKENGKCINSIPFVKQ